jgi:hypothetical protein
VRPHSRVDASYGMGDYGWVMDSDVVVWNSDARYRPELEVEIELVLAAHEIPGEYGAPMCGDLEVDIELELAPNEIPGQYHASLRRDLEVEMSILNVAAPFADFGDAAEWFVADDFYAAS